MDIKKNYGHCSYCICDDCSMIFNLYIEKSFRRKGNAKLILKEAIAKIRRTGYKGDIQIVATPQENSISKNDLSKFYKSLGLKVIDRNPHYSE